jgi:SAM-dependent methyltransferase
MPDFALLVRPASNRVFGGDATRLLVVELGVVAGSTVEGVRKEDIAGLEYVTFTGAPPLAAIAVLSSAYALFEREGDGRLRPVELPRVERFDDDLVTTQRYVGKTNETFTRLLVNLALASAGGTPHPVVLDPLCGRGTTLNHALLLGGDALGIDLDAKDTQAYATFLTTWLQEKRAKHQLDRTAGRHRFRVTIGSKSAAGAAERQTVDVATADTTEAPALFGKARADVIVTDLPYGVQHGSRTDAGLGRRPDDLLARALPAWRQVLRPGGAAAISWNTRVLARDRLAALVAEAGFALTTIGADGALEHRVDRTITRDVLVAVRPPIG